MFHRPGKKVGSLQVTPLKNLTRMMPAALILAEEKRNTLLSQIRDASALADARFDSIGLSLIHNLVNHCQLLPDTGSYYSQKGGLVDYSLNRTEAALDLFGQYLVRDGDGALSEEQQLWQYALFSAAILQGVGKLQSDYSVDLYDNNGQLLKQWNPLLDNLVSIGGHYRYEFRNESDDEFRCRLNLLLARLLMPASGFAWIASNSQVLAVWLALLNEDFHAAGTLGAILSRAKAIAIQRDFNLTMTRSYGSRGNNRYGRVGTFTGVTPESIAEIEQQVGIEFLRWLTKSLEAGHIHINKAPLFMVPGGLLVSIEAIQKFLEGQPEYRNLQASGKNRNLQVVQKGFLSLGLHRFAPDGSVLSRFQNNNQQMHSGILLADYAVVLPAEVKVHDLNTGKITTVAATELIHKAAFNHHFTSQQHVPTVEPLPYLNKAGQWQHTSQVAPHISPRPGVLNGV